MSNTTTYFSGYEESTVDPGWSLVVGSFVACILLHAILPCIVSLGSSYERSRNESNGSRSTSGSSTEDSSQESRKVLTRDDIDRSLSIKHSASDRSRSSQNSSKRNKHQTSQNDGRMTLEVVKEDEPSVTSVESKSTGPDENAKDEPVVPAAATGWRDGLLGWFCGVTDAFIIPSYEEISYPYTSRTASNKAPSTIRFVGSQISSESKSESSVFGGRSRRSIKLKRSRSNLSNADSVETVKRRGNELYLHSGQSDSGSKNHSISQSGSAMSCLHHDDVSFNEAMDSYEPTQYLLPNKDKSGEIDILFGEHAWWKPAMVTGGFNRVVGVAEYDKEFSSIVTLALPFSVQSFVAGLFNIMDIAVVSHYFGGSASSAFVVVPILTWITNTMNYGFCESLGKTIPVAMGKAQIELSGKYLNTTISLYTVGMVPTAIIWSMWTKNVFLWFGFDDATASIAQDYARMQILLEWITGIEYCIHLFLDMIGYEQYSTYTMFAQNIGQTFGIVIPLLIRKKDLLFVGFFRVAIAGALMFIDTCIVLYHGWIESFASGFLALPFRDLKVVRTIVSRAGFLGLAYFLTYGQWELLALFASALGPAELVAWGMLGHVWSAMKFISDGIADAAEERCALHLVSNQAELARLSAFKSLFAGLVSSIFVTSVLFMLSEQFVLWMTPDTTLQGLMIETFPLVGIGHIVMTSGIISWALVGAQGRYNIATLLHFAGSWSVTIPLSCIFTFAIRVDLQGLVSAVVMGLAMSSVGNLYILMRSEWEQIANLMCAENDIHNHVGGAEGGNNRLPLLPSSSPSPPIGKKNSPKAEPIPSKMEQQANRRHVSSFDASNTHRIPREASLDDSSVGMSSVTGEF